MDNKKINTKANFAMTKKTTHFGFNEIDVQDKARLVKKVFDSVASRYDLMNDIMSLGIHRLWKVALIGRIDPQPQMKLIDIGGGTGDIAFQFLKSGGGHVTICDVNKEMLDVGRNRAMNHGIQTSIEWVIGNAEEIPLSSCTFDAYATSFCLRNVTNIEKALNEAYRVLKPGGHFLCLEFSPSVFPILKKIYDTYSFNILPWLGKMIVDDEESYRYLAESIRRFPDRESFSNLIAKSGLELVNSQVLSGGIATIHSAWRV